MKGDIKLFEIKWTERAEKGLDKVVQYLEEEWSLESANHFLGEVDKVVKQISQYPYSYQESAKKGVRRAFPHPKTALIYTIRKRKKEIEIINVMGTPASASSMSLS